MSATVFFCTSSSNIYSSRRKVAAMHFKVFVNGFLYDSIYPLINYSLYIFDESPLKSISRRFPDTNSFSCNFVRLAPWQHKTYICYTSEANFNSNVLKEFHRMEDELRYDFKRYEYELQI